MSDRSQERPAASIARLVLQAPPASEDGWRAFIKMHDSDGLREYVALQRDHVADLLTEIERLSDRAVCSGCGSDVDESGFCTYEGCDDGQMIPASELPIALREACDAQTEAWEEHKQELADCMAEIDRLKGRAAS